MCPAPGAPTSPRRDGRTRAAQLEFSSAPGLQPRLWRSRGGSTSGLPGCEGLCCPTARSPSPAPCPQSLCHSCCCLPGHLPSTAAIHMPVLWGTQAAALAAWPLLSEAPAPQAGAWPGPPPKPSPSTSRGCEAGPCEHPKAALLPCCWKWLQGVTPRRASLGGMWESSRLPLGLCMAPGTPHSLLLLEWGGRSVGCGRSCLPLGGGAQGLRVPRPLPVPSVALQES